MSADRVVLPNKGLADGRTTDTVRNEALVQGAVANRKNSIVGRVDDVRRELSQDIAAVHKRVDTIPDRIMAMLRNTKGLIE